jgi:hypothetical protein
MTITTEMVKANHKLATIENFQDEGDYFVRRKMVQANPKLATQDNFNNELCRREYCSVCIEMLRANKNLATIENYKKANKTLDWYLRLAILKVNPDLATQNNFDNEKNEDVRFQMVKANPDLATIENFNKEKVEYVRRLMKRVNPALKSN